MATLAIIGSGTVGLATGKGFAEKGHQVTWYDNNPKVVERIRKEGIEAHLSNTFKGAVPDFVFLTVPTPTKGNEISLGHLEEAARKVGKWLQKSTTRKYPVIVVKSTVPPGTTERVVLPLLEGCSGKKSVWISDWR